MQTDPSVPWVDQQQAEVTHGCAQLVLVAYSRCEWAAQAKGTMSAIID